MCMKIETSWIKLMRPKYGGSNVEPGKTWRTRSVFSPICIVMTYWALVFSPFLSIVLVIKASKSTKCLSSFETPKMAKCSSRTMSPISTKYRSLVEAPKMTKWHLPLNLRIRLSVDHFPMEIPKMINCHSPVKASKLTKCRSLAKAPKLT